MTNPLTILARRPKRRGRTVAFLLTAGALALASVNPVQSAAGEQRGAKPTIVLVHGSWADASSWNGVTRAMSKRAGATITEYDAGHLGLMTNPGTVTRVVEQAARTTSR